MISSGFVYKIWLGKAVSANYLTLSLALIYFVFLMRYSFYGYILNGMGKIYIQMIITSIVAIIYIPLTVFMSIHFGLDGVFFSLIVTAFINSTWASIQYKKIINGKATGLWIR
jgi:O-antigen/teichoic acid export membrane protein